MVLVAYKTLRFAIPLLGLQVLSPVDSKEYAGKTPETFAVETMPTPNSLSMVEDLRRGALVSVGKAGVPYTQLTVFTDFQCPYCRDLDKSLKVLEAEAEADSLRIIFRSFPKSKHAWAMPAAIASVCGAEQNQRYYFDLSTYFYAHQPDLTASTVYSAAREVLANDNRFDSERFNICIANGMGKKIVDADIALGVRFGVSFTPTLFLNEKRFVGNRDLASLRRLLLRTSSLEH